MKNYLVSLLCFLSVAAFGQLPEKLKYDGLFYSYDSSTVLIFAGKKASVYDLVNSNYVVPPTKNEIIDFSHSNNYAEIDAKTGKLTIHLVEGGRYTRVYGDTTVCYVGYTNPANGNSWVDYNGKILNLNNDSISQKTATTFDWSQFRIEKIREGIYIITSFEKGVFNESGVVDLIKNEWLIYPFYQQCFLLNDFLFCLNGTEKKPWFDNRDGITDVQFLCYYDVYEMRADGVKLWYNVSVEPDTAFLEHILGVDYVRAADNSSYYVTEKEGKMGFVRFSLFEDRMCKNPVFEFRSFIEPTADFVYYEPYFSKLVTVSKGTDPKLQLFHVTDSLVLLADDPAIVHYNWENNYSNIVESISTAQNHFTIVPDSAGSVRMELSPEKRSYSPYGIGVHFVNDSLLHLSNAFPGYGLVLIRSRSFPDEDSVGADGSILYTYRDTPFGKSGIYNLNTLDWLIDPIYDQIYTGSGRFMCSDLMNQFSCFDSLGNLEFSGVSGGEVYQNPEYLKWLAPYKNPKQLFEAPNGFWHHRQLDKANRAYYVELSNGLALYKPGEYDFRNEFPNITGEFVHHNPSLQFTFVLDHDSIRLLKDGQTYAVSRQYGKISYVQPDQSGDPAADYVLELIEKTDTLVLGNYLPGYYSYTLASIELKNDLILVNDHTTQVLNACVECYDEKLGFINYSESHFESENSSVWKKNGAAWQKISPYYATIEQIRNGWFIASSGHFYKEFEVSGSPEGTEVIDLPARYFLLDSSLRAIPFLDYFDFAHIEDLGFGIKIKLDTGYYFFVTYSGIAVTDASWHHFELENGKLKAILHTTFMYDEHGDPVLDEFGLPVEATTETVKYFKLP
ncbi:MAG: hypothetical protein HYZ14_15625 [Bacteroidetes bacterium]|nr:hypothetical protein [Bacteroidota bacterium]